MISIAHKSVPGISVNRSEPAKEIGNKRQNLSDNRNTMENKELGNYIWQIIRSATLQLKARRIISFCAAVI
jgi:hypothetical protein